LAQAAGEPLLVEQVATVVVDALCRCGCSSLRLCTDGPGVPAERVAQLSGSGRRDHVAVESSGSRGAGKRLVAVVLHVIEGRLAELEVFDPVEGEGTAVPIAEIVHLSEPILV
jgi:hypothetical protein